MTALASSSISPPETARPSVELHDRWLRVRLGEGALDHADYHYIWLRHNCDKDRHPATGERIVCSSEIPAEVRPREAWVDVSAEALRVTWDEPSGRESAYPLAWLREHAYASGRGGEAPPSSSVAEIALDAGVWADPRALIDACLERVRRFGAAVVRGFRSAPGDVAPEDTERLIELFGAAGLRVIGTHFGRIEDLRTDNTTNQNTDQLGYTDAAVQLHTDQPFLADPPRYQMLHCMRPAAQGGESFLVDGEQAARYLASADEASFRVLSATPVVFDRKQKSFARRETAPILNMAGPFGFQIRYSYFTMAPHRLPFEQMEAFYRAYERFARVVRDPRHQRRFLLEAGDFLVYDNHRMLHARTSFEGARWLRGVYFDPA